MAMLMNKIIQKGKDKKWKAYFDQNLGLGYLRVYMIYMSYIKYNCKIFSLMDEQKIETLNEFEIIQSTGPQLTHKTVPSEHLEEYQKEMEKVRVKTQDQSFDFKSYGLRFDPSKHQPFSFRVSERLSDSEIVVLEVQIGGFALSVTVLNSDKNSPLSKRRPFSEGEYGRAYLLKSTKGEVVVKSISLFLNIYFNQRREMLAQMLKEYSIAKICEALGCGPSLPRAFGFDLLIFRNSIEFAMEKCSFLTVFSDEDEEKLSDELGIMHKHNLVHMDIKPFNIMRSTRGHLVFIDFGFSDAITEDCGYKTLTTYRGTPQFVSTDMLRLFSVNVIEGYVDLYHNDLTCLTNSINKIRLEVPSTEDKLSESYLPTDLLKSQQQPQTEKVIIPEEEYLFILFRHCYYFQKSQASQILNDNKDKLLDKFGQNIMKLFRKCPTVLSESFLSEHQTELSKSKQLSDDFMTRKNKSEFASFQEIKDQKPENAEKDLFSQRVSEAKETKEKKQEKNKYIVIEDLKSKDFFDSCEDKAQYYAPLFDCLRFDRKNFETEQKQALAKSFLSIIGNKDASDISDPLGSFKALFKHLLQYCLNETVSEWSKQHIFDVLLQAVMTDTDILGELSVIKGRVRTSSFSELTETFSGFFYLDKFLEKKGLFDDHTVGLSTIAEVKQILADISERVEQLSPSLSEESQINASEMMILVCKSLEDPLIFGAKIRRQCETVSEKRVKERIRNIFIIQELSCYNKCYKQMIFGERLSFLMETGELDNLRINETGFVQKLVFNQIIIGHLLQVYIIELLELTRLTINNDLIYNKLRFKYNVQNPKELNEQLKELSQICFRDKRFQLFADISIQWLHDHQKIIHENPQKYQNNLKDFFDAFYEYLQDNIDVFVQAHDKTISKIEDIVRSSQTIYQIPNQFWWISTLHFFLPLQIKIYHLMPDKVKNIWLLVAKIEWKARTNFALKQSISEAQVNIILQSNNYILNYRENAADLQHSFARLKHHIQIISQISDNTQYKNIFLSLLTLKNDFLKNKGAETSVEALNAILLRIHNTFQAKNQLVQIYLLYTTLSYQALSQILQIFVQTKQFSKVFEVIRKMSAFLSRKNLKGYQLKFFINIELFMSKNPDFFTIERVRSQFGRIEWTNRCSLIFYKYALQHIADREELKIGVLEFIRSIEFQSFSFKTSIKQFFVWKIFRYNIKISEKLRKKTHLSKFQLNIFLINSIFAKRKNEYRVQLRQKIKKYNQNMGKTKHQNK